MYRPQHQNTTFGVTLNVPSTLAEIEQFLATLPDDAVLGMYNASDCLGAQLLSYYNPQATEVGFGFTDVRLVFPGGLYVEVDLQQQAWLFFDYLFHRQGIGTHLETRMEPHPASTCPCGDPDCAATRPAGEHEEREFTVAGAKQALIDFRASPYATQLYRAPDMVNECLADPLMTVAS